MPDTGGSYLITALGMIVVPGANNRVFMGIFTCWCIACEDAGQATYSQLCLYVTGKYNHQQAGISSQTAEYVACHPVYTQRVHSYSRLQN